MNKRVLWATKRLLSFLKKAGICIACLLIISFGLGNILSLYAKQCIYKEKTMIIYKIDQFGSEKVKASNIQDVYFMDLMR